MTSRKKIWFTPEKADKTLPFVRGVVHDILEKGRELRHLLDDGGSAEEVRNAKAEIAALVVELEKIGCSYRDWNFDVGLVDFPAVMNGEEVFLCWRSDEDAVTWYHTPEGGFAGRKPIPKGLLKGGFG
jgi:hypothetical protein